MHRKVGGWSKQLTYLRQNDEYYFALSVRVRLYDLLFSCEIVCLTLSTMSQGDGRFTLDVFESYDLVCHMFSRVVCS